MRLTSRIAGIVTVLLAATALTACSASGRGGCTPEAYEGAASRSIAVTGAAGAAPKVRFATPISAERAEVSVVRRGTGPGLVPTQAALIDYTILNATTGEVVQATPYASKVQAVAVVPDDLQLPGLGKALVCATLGSRIAAVVPASQAYPAASRPQTVGAADALVIVADVRATFLDRADGADQVMAGGLPAVVLAPNGRPGVTVPAGEAPPKRRQVALLKAGGGAALKRSDVAVVHYSGFTWSDTAVVDSTWRAGSPTVLPIGGSTQPRGLATALEGERVGSQVLVVLPPGEAYGSAGTNNVPPGATLIYVVDILGTV